MGSVLWGSCIITLVQGVDVYKLMGRIFLTVLTSYSFWCYKTCILFYLFENKYNCGINPITSFGTKISNLITYIKQIIIYFDIIFDCLCKYRFLCFSHKQKHFTPSWLVVLCFCFCCFHFFLCLENYTNIR